jgi:hypothetical protein
VTGYIILAIIVILALYFLRDSKVPSTPKGSIDSINEDHVLVEVKFPGGLSPIDRAEKFEDPLSAKLIELKIGYCDGGGTEFGPKGEVTCSDIDVYLKDKNDIGKLQKICTDLKFPKNIVIELID